MSFDVIEEEQPCRLADHQVVAALLSHQGRIGLFRRSRQVTGDIGLWHCITGYLSDSYSPLTQAVTEVEEEVGISSDSLILGATAQIDLVGGDGLVWRVHAFHFFSMVDTITLNWENDAGCWVPFDEIGSYRTVSWLHNVMRALQPLKHPLATNAPTSNTPIKNIH
ncbi:MULTISPECIES: NUDIX domain-containing protein [Pseudomonas]|uniref:NUDIX domain-containing protein n=1 Tax=Pseudomonas TaxID=286 RepID=UPI0015BCC6AB|nr:MULTISPECIES: NUDIX domain-containing protein [Pseudomonas]MDH4846087.1 hypothetical protein [Pseudomonas sp. BN605]MDH4858759.1 hypothetical protein [Pseudomonas sp. BN505]NWL08038.1 hypothetical protein [Pseudomonas hunanensis]